LKRITHQRTAVIGFNDSQADFTFGKIHDLQRARIFNQAVNAVDNQLFWRDQ
jgi:hypothetical protein